MPPPATRAATGRLRASKRVKRDELRTGWRTDFLVHEGAAQILERDDCIVVRTPDNPAYYWGNFLVLPEAPADDALNHWQQRFALEVAQGQPLCQHVAIGVSAPYAQQQLPRWRWNAGIVNAETGFDAATSSALQAMGHVVQPFNDSYQDYGAGQFIWRLGSPAVEGYAAASDPRRDGQAAGY